ncbi:hypothetical protein LT85_p004 (plasmid) [Collimonas arenae]|uniref:KfrB domain-containing protein n=1 Tax=Collimonas arenae TaxID=279058 RepID=A0A0A1FHC8_9BURK|nr:hypothetical protein [Collimonas arenae]AIY44183.1 hypothetical protein LT85_p004 [Collimonas arenae]
MFKNREDLYDSKFVAADRNRHASNYSKGYLDVTETCVLGSVLRRNYYFLFLWWGALILLGNKMKKFQNDLKRSVELEVINDALQLIRQGRRDKLTQEERVGFVRILESTMQSQVKNQMPSAYEMAAMSAARSFVYNDSRDALNPFKNESLRGVYKSEKAFMEKGNFVLLAEKGGQYNGTITSVDDKYVVQLVKINGRERNVQHERIALSSLNRDLLRAGENVEIRYPANRVGIVKEFGSKEAQGKIDKGIEPKSFGR